MTRIISWVGALALAAVGAAACGDDDIPGLGSMDNGGSGGSAGRGGAGGTGAGTGGSAAGTGGGSPAGAGGSAAGAGGNAAGTGGSGDAPDAGESDASVASDAGDAGACTEASCVCAVDVITAVPYSQQWQTTEDTEADVVDLECQPCDNTADHIVTFTAPAAGTYRFFASSGGDVELAVYPGDCTAAPEDIACGEDLDLDNEDYNDQVDVEIAQGATVTVVVGESCEENGGAGTLTIQLAP